MNCYNFKKTKKRFLGKNYTFYVADTPKKRNIGFSGIEKPAGKVGIIFIYEDEKIRTFTMKNTKFPLHIYFFDKSWNLVHQQLLKAKSGLISSKKPAYYVVEIPA